MAVENFDVRAMRHAIESVEGTAETLATADAVRVINGQGQIQSDPIVVNYDKPDGGSRPERMVRRRLTVTGEVPLLGAAASGDASVYSGLYRNFGHTEALNVGPPANAEYTPVLKGPSATGAFDHAGELLLGTGARGRFTSLNFAINDFPKAGFELLAHVPNDPTEISAWNDDVSAFGLPIIGTEANMTFALGGVDLEFVSLSMDTGIQVGLTYHSEGVVSRHRARNVRGTLRVFRPTIAASPIRQLARTGAFSSFLLDYVTGTAADDLSLQATNVQVGEPQNVDQEGQRAWDIPVNFTADYTLRFGSRT